MALSNWDTLAFNEKAEPCIGEIEGFAGGSVEIYKNWLYVRDPKMWAKDRRFVEPTIAEVQEGHIIISDFEIRAARGPQNSVLACVTSLKYQEQEKDKPYKPPFCRRMAGIGCYGFADPIDVWCAEFGITLGEEDNVNFGSYISPDGNSMTMHIMKKGWEDSKDPRGEGLIQDFAIPRTPENEEKFETKWVGVQPATLKALIDFLKSLFNPRYDREEWAWVEKIEAARAIRFNQGDAYFAQRLDIGGVGTEVGKAETPVLMQLLGGKDEEGKSGDVVEEGKGPGGDGVGPAKQDSVPRGDQVKQRGGVARDEHPKRAKACKKATRCRKSRPV